MLLTKCLWKCPSSTKYSLLWKTPGWVPALRHYSFCKTLHLKCLTVFRIPLYLDNCSVISIVTLCFALNKTHSGLIQNKTHSNAKLFADDTSLFSVVHSITDSANLLNSDLSKSDIQDSDIFRILFIQVCECIFKHIQHYQSIFNRIEKFIRHIQAYADIFSTLFNRRIFGGLPYPGQNIWNKIKKSSKNGQVKKSLIYTFARFWTAIAKV